MFKVSSLAVSMNMWVFNPCGIYQDVVKEPFSAKLKIPKPEGFGHFGSLHAEHVTRSPEPDSVLVCQSGALQHKSGVVHISCHVWLKDAHCNHARQQVIQDSAFGH